MILFKDLPDIMSAQIDEFIQYNRWKARFTHDVVSFFKRPRYGPDKLKNLFPELCNENMKFKKHFLLRETTQFREIYNEELDEYNVQYHPVCRNCKRYIRFDENWYELCKGECWKQ